jgi:hypothetical protein
MRTFKITLKDKINEITVVYYKDIRGTRKRLLQDVRKEARMGEYTSYSIKKC